MVGTGCRGVVGCSVLVCIVQKRGCVLKKSFVDGEGDIIRSTSRVTRLHDDFSTKRNINIDDVWTRNFSVEAAQDGFSSLVVVGLPGPRGGPELSSYSGHGCRVIGGGSKLQQD